MSYEWQNNIETFKNKLNYQISLLELMEMSVGFQILSDSETLFVIVIFPFQRFSIEDELRMSR